MDAMERVPTSYLVIHNSFIEPERRSVFEAFLAAAVTANRLRFINRFDDSNDLYAVVKTEPDARSEAPLPFTAAADLSALIAEDSTELLKKAPRFQTLYRIYLTSSGNLPRYEEFMRDARTIARGVILESENTDQIFDGNLRDFVQAWVGRDAFVSTFGHLTDAQFVDKLLMNASVKMDATERDGLINDLASGRETRAGILLRIVNNHELIDKENDRSLLLLHYFGYLRRNPDDPPDHDLHGFNFWLQQLAKSHDVAGIAAAFKQSIEYHAIKERPQ